MRPTMTSFYRWIQAWWHEHLDTKCRVSTAENAKVSRLRSDFSEDSTPLEPSISPSPKKNHTVWNSLRTIWSCATATSRQNRTSFLRPCIGLKGPICQRWFAAMGGPRRHEWRCWHIATNRPGSWWIYGIPLPTTINTLGISWCERANIMSTVLAEEGP